jgi:hypothetical protein
VSVPGPSIAQITAVTDDAGRYPLNGVPAGQLMVMAMSPPRETGMPGSTSKTVTLTPVTAE